MRENLHPLFKSSATRTVSSSGTESIGLRADARGVMVFASPSRLFHRAPGLTILTRTWYRLTISSCTRTFQPSARTCKNHATATQTATNQTAGPLGCNNVFIGFSPLAQMCLRLKPDYFLILDYFVMNHSFVTLHMAANRPTLRKLIFKQI